MTSEGCQEAVLRTANPSAELISRDESATARQGTAAQAIAFADLLEASSVHAFLDDWKAGKANWAAWCGDHEVTFAAFCAGGQSGTD